MALLTTARRRKTGKDRLLAAAFPTQRQVSNRFGGRLAGWTDPVFPDLALNRPGEVAFREAELRQERAPLRTAVARALRVSTDEQAWRLNAEGAVKVADMLAQLDDRWRVLHAVPMTDRLGTIDHVVIGPSGVYCLATKHHPGSSVLVARDLFMVDGQRYAYTESARRVASAAKVRLTAACGFPIQVTGVVVAVGTDDFLIKRAPTDVSIITRARVNRWLGAQETALDPQQTARIFAAARRSEIWQ